MTAVILLEIKYNRIFIDIDSDILAFMVRHNLVVSRRITIETFSLFRMNIKI